MEIEEEIIMKPVNIKGLVMELWGNARMNLCHC